MSEDSPLLKGEQPPPKYEPSAPTYQPSDPLPPYQGNPPPAQSTTVIAQPVIMTTTVQQLGEVPIQTRCPNCHTDVITHLDHSPGSLAWLVVFLLCLLGFWWGCCLIPLCIEGLHDVDHICPNCKYTIGTFKRL